MTFAEKYNNYLVQVRLPKWQINSVTGEPLYVCGWVRLLDKTLDELCTLEDCKGPLMFRCINEANIEQKRVTPLTVQQ